MPPAVPDKIRVFDEGFLQTMTPPLTVYVNRVVAGRTAPVNLQPRNGQTAPNVGWTLDDVRGLGKELMDMWERRELKDGTYAISVTDATQRSMSWEMLISVQADPTPREPQAQSPQVLQMPPPIAPRAYPQQVGQPQMVMNTAGQLVPMYPQIAPQPPTMMTPMAMPIAAPPSGQTDRERALEKRLHDMEMAAVKEREDRERERQQGVHKQEILTLQQQIAQVTELVKTQAQTPAKPAVDPEITRRLDEAERRALAAEQAAKEADRRAVETARESRFDATVNALTSKIDAMQQSAIAAAAAPKGPDPLLLTLIDTLKEMNRNAPTHRDLMDIAKSARDGADTLMSKQVDIFMGAWNMLKNGMEMLNGMRPSQPAENPFMSALAAGVGKLPDLAEKYFESIKLDRTPPPQRIVMVPTPPAAPPEPAAPPQAAPAQTAAEPQPTSPVQAAEESTGATPINVDAAEQQLFGMALADVKRLRAAIERGQRGGSHVEGDEVITMSIEAALALGQAIDAVRAHKYQIKAFQEYYEKDRVADFVDLVITNSAPAPFRNEVTALMVQVYRPEGTAGLMKYAQALIARRQAQAAQSASNGNPPAPTAIVPTVPPTPAAS